MIFSKSYYLRLKKWVGNCFAKRRSNTSLRAQELEQLSLEIVQKMSRIPSSYCRYRRSFCLRKRRSCWNGKECLRVPLMSWKMIPSSQAYRLLSILHLSFEILLLVFWNFPRRHTKHMMERNYTLNKVVCIHLKRGEN